MTVPWAAMLVAVTACSTSPSTDARITVSFDTSLTHDKPRTVRIYTTSQDGALDLGIIELHDRLDADLPLGSSDLHAMSFTGFDGDSPENIALCGDEGWGLDEWTGSIAVFVPDPMDPTDPPRGAVVLDPGSRTRVDIRLSTACMIE